MKFAICQELFVDWDWERQCRFAAELGYTGMELAPFTIAKDIRDVSAETRQTMREQAEAAGVQIIGLHWLLAKTEGFQLTTADKDVRQATCRRRQPDLSQRQTDRTGVSMLLTQRRTRLVELFARRVEIRGRPMVQHHMSAE